MGVAGVVYSVCYVCPDNELRRIDVTNKFPIRENGGCVEYVVSVARAALGMSPELPVKLDKDGPFVEEITDMLHTWFSGHTVKFWGMDYLREYATGENVTYMGDKYEVDYDLLGRSVMLYLQVTGENKGHAVIGLPVGEFYAAIAVERGDDG